MRKFLYSDSDVDTAHDLATLVRLVAAGRLHPEIGRTADWTGTPEVLTELVNRRIRGNVVLEVSPA